MTFDEIVAAEPRVGELMREAQAVKYSGPKFCANAVWYGYSGHRGIKPRLETLVGWFAENKALTDNHTYDVAYQTIYDALPSCGSKCSCM